MIVRDEANVLPDCLTSITGVADQLVVIDTGSVDGTPAIAESFGAEVHHFKWVDDFAAARNESLRHAVGDWIFWLDADERLPASSVGPLKQLVVPVTQPTIYQVQIRNLQPDGKSYTLSMSHRLFSRHPKLCFSGRIHEQVHPSLRAAKGIEKESLVVLEHQGYALDQEKMRVKLERNQTLLERMVSEEPNSGYAHYTLGQNYALLGEHEQALRVYHQALKINEFKDTGRATLLNAVAEAYWHLDQLDEAEEYVRKSLAITPNQASGNFIMYRICRSREDLEGQIEFLSNILPLSRQSMSGSTSDLPKDVLIPREHLLFTLGQLYLAVENYSAAEQALKGCLELEPGSRETRELLVAALTKRGKWEELLSVLPELPQPLSDQHRELNGVALIKLQRFEEAIGHYLAWLQEDATRGEVRKRLAGLYAKIGNRDAAEQLLKNISS